MRIIDNRKDFYDYGVMYDTDDSICYVRKTSLLKPDNQEHLPDIEKLERMIKDIIPCRFTGGNDETDIYIEHILVGIYPNIYLVPVACFYDYVKGIYGLEKNPVLTGVPLDIYTDSARIQEYIASKYPMAKNRKVRGYAEYRKTLYRDCFAAERVIKNNFVIELPEAFAVLGCPTFIHLCDFYPGGHRGCKSEAASAILYAQDKSCYGQFAIIKNPVFTACPSFVLNPIRQLLDNTPVYNNIENFLWSIKQEPISEPDNKTKILNHGFDLKTSFRKM